MQRPRLGNVYVAAAGSDEASDAGDNDDDDEDLNEDFDDEEAEFMLKSRHRTLMLPARWLRAYLGYPHTRRYKLYDTESVCKYCHKRYCGQGRSLIKSQCQLSFPGTPDSGALLCHVRRPGRRAVVHHCHLLV